MGLEFSVRIVNVTAQGQESSRTGGLSHRNASSLLPLSPIPTRGQISPAASSDSGPGLCTLSRMGQFLSRVSKVTHLEQEIKIKNIYGHQSFQHCYYHFGLLLSGLLKMGIVIVHLKSWQISIKGHVVSIFDFLNGTASV